MVLNTEGAGTVGAAEAGQQVKVDFRVIGWPLGLCGIFLFDERYSF